MAQREPTNDEIANVLVRIANALESMDANEFRIRAYRNAAGTVRGMDQSVAEIVREKGQAALEDLPNVGTQLARVIAGYVNTGHSDLLRRLQGEASPADLFTQIPGIGQDLAQRIVDQLDVNTLEELEQAAHDGRLAKVEGFGPKRVESVRVALAGMLSGAAQRHKRRVASGGAGPPEPPVGVLLDVDAAYRHRAQAGELPTIAPKRFNPEGEAWLPLMHAERGGWQFTALYSNTARAHQLNKTHDWVVIYYKQDSEEDQVTVVTAGSGALEGKRVVRGREAECRQYYESEG